MLCPAAGIDLRGPASSLQAISVLAAIVTIHELGHFIAARSQNIHVTKFSIGFGPALFKYQVSINVAAAYLKSEMQPHALHLLLLVSIKPAIGTCQVSSFRVNVDHFLSAFKSRVSRNIVVMLLWTFQALLRNENARL